MEAPGAEVTTKGQGAEVRAPGATPPFRQLPFAAHFEVVGLFVKGRSARRRVDVSPVGASQFDEEYEVVSRRDGEERAAGSPGGTTPFQGRVLGRGGVGCTVRRAARFVGLVAEL